MNHLSRVALVFACLLITAIPTAARAQLCFDIFEDLTEPSLSCADVDYFIDGPTSGPADASFFGNAGTGVLGAGFDGFDLFDPEDPELAPPDNLLEPFFSNVQYQQTDIAGQIDSFQAQHRGSVSMGARDSEFQSAAYGTKSRITIIPFTTDGSTDPVILDLDFKFDFTLADPSDNATDGSALAGAGARIFSDDPQQPLFHFNGGAQLDLDFDPEPDFFGDFDDFGTFEPSGPSVDDEFDIEVDFDTTFQATPGQPLTLDTDTFGSIFTDGFESGDTSAWSASSGDTFVFTVSSSNPNVRFMFVVEGDQGNPAEISGLWYDSSLDGEGYNVIQSAAGTTIFYYGNDQSGNKLWLVSDTLSNSLVLNETVTFPMLIGSGDGTFDSPAPSSQLTAWGSLGVTVDSNCTSGTFVLDGLDGSKTSNVVQLAGIEGVICEAAAGKTLASAGQGIHPSGAGVPISGLWYDPSLDGEGYNVIQSSAGTTIFFYGYDQAGNRLWLVSDTLGDPLVLNQTLVFPMLVGANGTFAAPAPSSGLTNWGTLEVTIDSCTSGTFLLTGTDGAKNSNAVQLAGIEGVSCP